jgi:sporulation protein YlmC with PRC-barrel domain
MKLREPGIGRRKLAVTVTAVALALGSAAQAQDAQRENANRPGDSAQVARSDAGMQSLDRYLQSNTLRVSKLVGMDVQSRSGETLGEVEEVLRGMGPGQNMELVVQVGGETRAGADPRLVAIPFDEIQISGDGDELYTSRTREQLASAPAVELTRRTAGAIGRPGAVEPRAGQADANRGAASASSAANERRLGDLVGADVMDGSGDEIGEIDDIVISMAGADRLRAVLQVGGIAGIGAKRVAVPLSEVTIDRASDGSPTLRVAMDRSSLERLPEFEYEDQRSIL